MKNRCSVVLLICLVHLGLTHFAAAQSLYQDAKSLARFLRESDSRRQNDDYWFRLSNALPVIFADENILPVFDWPIKSLYERDYLIINLDATPDSLVVYFLEDGARPEEIVIAFKHDFCILQIRENGYVAAHDLRAVTPSGDGELFYNDHIFGPNSFIDAQDTSSRHFMVFEGRPGAFEIRRFSDNEFTCKDKGMYIIPQLPVKDKLEMSLGGKKKQLSLSRPNQYSADLSVEITGDSIRKISDTGNEYLSPGAQLSMPYQPVIFYNNIDFGLFSDAVMRVLGALSNESPFLLSDRWQTDADILLRILPNDSEKIPNKNDLNLRADSIPVNDLVGDIHLERYPVCCSFDEMTFFRGANKLKTVPLRMAQTLQSVRLDEQNGRLVYDVELGNHFNSYIPELDYFRKQSTSMDAADSFQMKGLSRQFHQVDYCCRYNDFVTNPQTREGRAISSYRMDSLLVFTIAEINPGVDTIASQCSFAELRKKTFYKGKQYTISLNLETATRASGIWDLRDLYFELYQVKEDAINETVKVFNWKPGANSDLVIFWQEDKVYFYCTPATVIESYIQPVVGKDTLCVLLGVHTQLRQDDLKSENLWGEISAKYRNNPYLGSVLSPHLAASSVEQLPGYSNDAIAQQIAAKLQTYYAWQRYLLDGARLDTADQVSYAELSETYRTPIPTASEDLQVASEQFETESRKLKRGLNTADLAAGLSDFIVERAQEELNINFLDRLKSNILSDSSEFNVLFPKSTRVMQDFDIRQYRTLLLYARGAFEQDLRNLGVRFPKLFSLPKYHALQNDPNVYNIFLLYDIANKVYEDMSIDTVLLHVHNRLQERKMNLEEEIFRHVSDSLRVDPLKRTELSTVLDSFIQEYDAYYKSYVLLKKMYNEELWASVYSQVESYPNLMESFTTQFPEPEYETGFIEYVAERPIYLAPLLFARNNINGDPDYDYLINSMKFNQFDEYFEEEPDTAFTISLGLGRARKLLDTDKVSDYKQQIDELEARVRALIAYEAKLSLHMANTYNTLNNYMPIFEKLKALQVKRLMLSLALETEIRRLKPDEKHAKASLTYLNTVLQSPQSSGMHEWNTLDSLLNALPVPLDSLQRVMHDVIRPFSLPITSEIYYYENLELVSSLSEKVDRLNKEIEAGTAFVDNLTQMARRQFARTAAARDTLVSHTMLDTLYRYFKFTGSLTNGTLVPNFEFNRANLLALMDTVFSGATPTRPMYESALTPEMIHIYDLGKPDANWDGPDASGNPFLDNYDQYLMFFMVNKGANTRENPYQRQFEMAYAGLAKLDTLGRSYQQKISQLNDRYAPHLTPSLAQAQQFDNLVQVTLLWLQAFKNGDSSDGSITVNDTTVLHINRKLGADTYAEYDSLLIKKRKIASGTGVRQWITPQQFNEVMEDTLTRKAFLGLLHQRMLSVNQDLNYATPNMTLLAAKFMNNLYEIDDAREMLRYKKRNSQPLAFEDYFPFIRTTVNMINIIFETPVRAGTPGFKDRFPALAQVPEISNESLSLFENVFAQNYSDAIRNVAHLLSITWGLNLDGKTNKPALLGGNLSIKQKRKLEQQIRINEKVKSSILLYGSFMANMAEAQSPDQIKAAIRSVAVPPGNSSVKRNTYMNLDLNGYFGATYFRETLNADAIPDEYSQKGGVGLSVPVGITFSMGQLGRKKRHSFSLFFPVIDLGAVTAFRLQEENLQSELPELSFKNLITPGAYLMYNVPKSPFTIGVGGQVGPQLRKVTVNGNELSTSAYRFGVTASIDVPIFNFYSRQERK